jgi:SGNH domain (fused to AT3 domains)
MAGRPMRVALRYGEFMERQSRAFRLLDRLASEYAVEIIFPDKMLCDSSECAVMRDNRVLYSDDDHLSVRGALYLRPLLQKALPQ